MEKKALDQIAAHSSLPNPILSRWTLQGKFSCLSVRKTECRKNVSNLSILFNPPLHHFLHFGNKNEKKVHFFLENPSYFLKKKLF